MGFLDILLGRSRPVPPNLDVLFSLPSAAVTLQAALAVRPTGVGAVCFRPAEGAREQGAQDEILGLLRLEPETSVQVVRDEYGFLWIICRQEIADLAGLVTALHAVDTTLSDNGFGSQLLCTVIGFTGDGEGSGQRLGLVYLFKRGTFYPFAPTPDRHRDEAFELRVRAALSGELPIEPDLTRWFPLWNAPVP